MISVSFSSSFIKFFHKLKKSNSLFESQFDDKLNIFLSNPYDSRLKTHKLSGKLSLLWSFSINFQIRVIFVFVDSQKVIFEEIGTHDEVY